MVQLSYGPTVPSALLLLRPGIAERHNAVEDGGPVRRVFRVDVEIALSLELETVSASCIAKARLGHAPGDGTMRFRFCPKSPKGFGFKIQSNVPALDGRTGGITAYIPSPDVGQRPSAKTPNWWTDDPSPDVAEESHSGAKTVSRWREDFLDDFAQRMLRCQSASSAETEK